MIPLINSTSVNIKLNFSAYETYDEAAYDDEYARMNTEMNELFSKFKMKRNMPLFFPSGYEEHSH